MPVRRTRLHARRRPARHRLRLGPLAAAGLGSVLALHLVSDGPASAVDAGMGQVVAVGAAASMGDAAGRPVTAIARTPTGHGYWLAARDGGVYAYGDADFRGAATGSRGISDLAATPSGKGYWLVGEDGGVFAFGDAPYLGSLGDLKLSAPVVGIAATPSGQGYWLAAENGGVFAFGDAAFAGSAASAPVNQPVVAISATPAGDGYRLLGRDGGVYAFGAAAFAGAPAAGGPFADLVTTADGKGYWTVSAAGQVSAFGSAPATVAAPGGPGAPVTSADATPAGDGLWLATGGKAIGTFKVTCYALQGTTATGTRVGEGVVAVDPRAVPLGTQIFVDGLGVKTALDTGGNIRGRRLDIWHPSVSYCRQFGTKSLTAYAVG